MKDYYCPPDLYDVIYSDIRDDIPFWVMELLLRATGFARFAVEARTGYAAGSARKPALEDGDHLVWTAWKD